MTPRPHNQPPAPRGSQRPVQPPRNPTLDQLLIERYGDLARRRRTR